MNQIFYNVATYFKKESEYEAVVAKSPQKQIRIEDFINFLEENFRRENYLNTFDFVSISKIGLPEDKENTIYKIALKSILHKANPRKIEILKKDIAAVDELLMDNFEHVSAEILQDIINLSTEQERTNVIQAINLLPHWQRERDAVLAIISLFKNTNAANGDKILNQIRQMLLPDRGHLIIKSAQFLRGEINKSDSILNTLRLTPRSEREDIIKKALACFENITEWDGYENILATVSSIDSKNRNDVFAKAQCLLKGIFRISEKEQVINYLTRLHPYDRTVLIDTILALIQTLSIPCSIELMSAINGIKSVEGRDTIIEQATSLVQQARTYDQFWRVIWEISHIPLPYRSGIIKIAKPVLVGDSPSDIANFLQAVGQVRLGSVADVLETTVAAVLNFGFKSDKAKLLKEIADLGPNQQDPTIIEPICRAIETLTFPQIPAEFIKTIELIPKEKRTSLASQAILSLFKYISTPEDCTLIVDTVRSFPEEERANILEQANPALEGFCLVTILIKILISVANIQKDDREQVVKEALAISKPWLISKSTRILLLKILASLPKPDRNEKTSSNLGILLKDVFITDTDLFLQVFESIPEEKRANVLETTARYIKEGSDEIERAGILLACALNQDMSLFVLPPLYMSDFANLAPHAKTCLTFIPNQYRNDFLIQMLKEILLKNSRNVSTGVSLFSFLPQNLRTIPFLFLLSKFIFLANSITKIRYVLSITAPEHWEDIGHQLSKLEWVFGWSTIKEFTAQMFSRESIRKASTQHLKQFLESNQPPVLHWQIVQWILNSHEHMHLHEEHELVQLAISVASICDPDALKNLKNPYRIHSEIKKVVASEEWVAIKQETNVQWNLTKLREKGLWKGYTAKDLPLDIGPDTIKDLFTQFEKRLGGLEQSKRDEIREYIHESCQLWLDGLRSNLLDKPFITGLLNRDANLDDPVSPSKFQLYTILRAILDADSAVKENEKLSEQEDMLLKMSASIQNCSTGQRDGLANFYNALPTKYKHGPQAREGSVSAAEFFVDMCVQKTLNATFNSRKILSLVNVISQASHATEYLKNRFHRQVGLQHHIVFDAHTGVLPNHLLELKTEEFVTTFFKVCTPDVVIKQMICDSQDAFKGGLYVGIEGLIKSIVGEINGEDEYRKYSVYDDETIEPIRLTEAGATALLAAVGYVVDKGTEGTEGT